MNNKGKAQWCEKHWEPFRVMAGSGGINASMGLVQLVINDPEFQKKVPATAKANEQQKAMEELCPLCCRYTDYLDHFHKIMREQCRMLSAEETRIFIHSKFAPPKPKLVT